MSRRDLQVWVSISEIIGAFAIVVSLLYVAYELRENNRILQVNSRQVLSEQDLRLYEAGMDTSVIARALDKTERGEQLSDLERSQLRFRQGLNFRIFEHAFSLYRNGALNTEEWERYQAIVNRNICGDEIARQMWAGADDSWNPEFRQYVDSERQNCSN